MLFELATTVLLPLPAPQVPPGAARGRERMAGYPTATAEDLKQPPLIRWQRSYDDAVAVAKATQRPLLLVMNMDGEPASETFAGLRYRDPEFAKKVEPYVAVVASIQRHSPRDYDERGRRVVCPRLGCVTCGEHIAAEKVLFEKHFKDNPVAPRHIAVGNDGKVLFDRFLDTNLRVVDEALVQHAPARWTPATEPRDGGARDAEEKAYLDADTARRRALLAAAKGAAHEPFDVIRLGLHDDDAALRGLAVDALDAAASARTLPLVTHALSLALAEPERQRLLATLERVGKDDAEARNVVKILQALATPSARVEVAKWLAKSKDATARTSGNEDLIALETRLNELDAEVKQKPTDGAVRLRQAEATLRFAEARMNETKDAAMLFEDARRAAAAAKQRGAPAHLADAIAARSAWWLSQPEQAAELAAGAVAAFAGDAGSTAAVELLWCFARARVSGLWLAINEKRDWPPAWVSDAHAAFQVLARHPLGTAEHAAMHVDFLNNLSAQREAERTLAQALERFPNAPPLHEHFRNQVLHRAGLPAIESAYETLRAQNPDPAQFEWFHGYATLIVAEMNVRANDRAAARTAYARALARFDTCVARNAAFKDSADHYAALALAGDARLALDARDHETAVDRILGSLRRRPASANSPDGLERTPAQTLGLLKAAMQRSDQPDLSEKLELEVKKIAPELW